MLACFGNLCSHTFKHPAAQTTAWIRIRLQDLRGRPARNSLGSNLWDVLRAASKELPEVEALATAETSDGQIGLKRDSSC